MKRIILASFSALLMLSSAQAADVAKGDRKNQPIQIKSNALTTDSDKRTAIFSGKVSARQDDVVIYCDRLVVTYNKEEKQVDKVEAFGNVRIIQNNRLGLAGHGIYDHKAGKIILDDNPRLFQDEDEVSGKVITYYTDSKRSEVTSDADSRVIAIIHPKQKDKDSSARP
jgi:lipopolysaccharide export system protein LptA